MRIAKVAIGLALTLSLAACSSLAPTEQETLIDAGSGVRSSVAGGEPTPASPTRHPGDLTRYAGIDVPPVDQICTEWPCPSDYAGAYTSVEALPVQLNVGDGSRSDVVLPKNGLLKRFISPGNNTVSYALDVTVDGHSTANTAFVLLTRNDGENHWQSDIVVSRVMTSLFKVEENMKFGLKSNFSSENLEEPRLARLLFQAAENIAEVAAPGSGLLTVLARPGTDRTKLLIDQTLAGLFSGKHSESLSVERKLTEFSTRPGWGVALFLNDEDDSNGPAKLVAKWMIRLSDPQPSVFSSRTYREPLGSVAARNSARRESDKWEELISRKQAEVASLRQGLKSKPEEDKQLLTRISQSEADLILLKKAADEAKRNLVAVVTHSDDDERKLQLTEAYADIAPADVLDRVIVNEQNQTFRQLLNAQPTFTDLLIAANEKSSGTPTEKARKAAGNLCKLVRNTIRSANIRLTTSDESVVVWAVFKFLSFDTNSKLNTFVESDEAKNSCKGPFAELKKIGLLTDG